MFSRDERTGKLGFAESLRAVVFDFDYTLADSSAGTMECINFALTNLGLPAVSPARAYETIGLSLSETFYVLAGITDEALASHFARFFVQRADMVMEPLTHLYDSVPQTVGALRQRGIPLAIVSTKFRYRIEQILKRHGLSGQFDVIVGGEDVTDHKPDPSGLLLALACLGVRPDEAIYIGDHVVDAEAARRAGVPFVAVLSGTCRKEDFADHPVCCFADSVGDLLTWDGS
jgi:phosphoglycolate phosphatase